jgi:hypothetical protein
MIRDTGSFKPASLAALGPFAQNGRFGKIFAKIWLAKRRFLYDCMGRFGPELEEN